MLTNSGIIKSAMGKRGYRHQHTDDEFNIRGQYARNLQYVYSKEHKTANGVVIDLVYFAVDILGERLVMGFYRENPQIERGVYANVSRSLSLLQFTKDNIEKELDKLILPGVQLSKQKE